MSFGGLYEIARARNFQRERDNVKFNLRLEFETSLAAVAVVAVTAVHFAQRKLDLSFVACIEVADSKRIIG